MRIFEVNNFLNRFNAFLLESFKDDMYRLYPEQKDNMDFKDAITFFNTHKQVKDGIKKMIKDDENIESSGNLADDIKKKFDTGEKFIAAVTNLLDVLNTSIEKGKKKSYGWKKQIGQEYAKILQAVKAGQEPDVDDTDFWLIPCRTYEELHGVSQKYTGILPILSRDKIESEYGVEVPKEATHYKTSRTPEWFLEYMKKQTNFFMDPSWCVAKNERYFNGYKLETPKDEKPRCYVLISKKYPNVRFCITLRTEEKALKEIFYKEEKIKVSNPPYTLSEVRDPWQIGGSDPRKTGLKMMELAFGQQKIDKIIKDICSPETKMVPFSELEDGTNIFFKASDIQSISSPFNNLINGNNMFKFSSIEKLNCNFPVLEAAHDMFMRCGSLSEFTGNLPKLTDGIRMFYQCEMLETFDAPLPKLEKAEEMFYYCKNLKSFNSKLPNLINGDQMFSWCNLTEFKIDMPKLRKNERMFGCCKRLETFDSDLSSLTDTYAMFSYSGIKTFKSNLPELILAQTMFYQCEMLETFDTPLPKLEKAEEMFYYCKNLKSFNSKLPNLINGDYMFSDCNLTEFKIDMPKLKNAYGMFGGNKNLKSFNCELSNLKDGEEMFFGCEHLTSFRSDLSSLNNGSSMFNCCKNLSRFESDLSSLENGYNMFRGCKLDTQSVKNIAETISTASSYDPTITIGVDKMDEEKKKYIKMIEEKGWDVEIK